MFRDQKNINVKVVGWLLLAIFAANAHYLCLYIYLDVYHLNYYIDLSFIGLRGIRINDIFLFFNAPKAVSLDIQYYLYFVGMRINTCILAYLLYSAITALNTIMDTVVKQLNFYRRIRLLVKIYLFVQLYALCNYILFAGQFMRGVPLIFYSVLVLLIFFVHRNEKGWYIKAEL